MTAEELHILVFFIIDKNSGEGIASSVEENVIYNRAQYAYQNFLMGEVQQYQNGRPISRIDYSQNEKIRQRLTPCITNAALSITSGIAPYPADYLLADKMLTTDDKNIKYVSPERLVSFLGSVIDEISDNPIYLILNDGFHFYPTTMTSAKLTYVKTAPEINYATTLDGNGREVYDSANSANPIWDEIDMLEIVVRALAIIGIPLQLQQVQGYAQAIKTQGQ